jgi:hypothetical protein
MAAIWKRTLVWLKCHTYVKKQSESSYGCGTITYKTTFPKTFVNKGLKNMKLQVLLNLFAELNTLKYKVVKDGFNL